MLCRGVQTEVTLVHAGKRAVAGYLKISMEGSV